MSGDRSVPDDHREIEAWVCAEGCGYWRKEESTGVHQTENPADWRGPSVRHDLARKVYVPSSWRVRAEAAEAENKQLCSYIKEAAGNESVLIPVKTLADITERAEAAEGRAATLAEALREAEAVVTRARADIAEMWALIPDRLNRQPLPDPAVFRLEAFAEKVRDVLAGLEP